eukprot:403335761
MSSTQDSEEDSQNIEEILEQRKSKDLKPLLKPSQISNSTIQLSTLSPSERAIVNDSYASYFSNIDQELVPHDHPNGITHQQLQQEIQFQQQRQEESLKRLEVLDQKQVFCKKMGGIAATIWDPEKKIYVTNPLLKEFESQYKSMPKGMREEELIEIQKCFSEIVMLEHKDCDDKLKCDICLDNQSQEDNQLVVCEICLAATHQKCYGLDLKDRVPENVWLCIRCKYLKQEYKDVLASSNKRKLSEISRPFCLFCNDLQGIIVQLQGGPLSDHWVHIVCVNWSNQCSFILNYNRELVYQLDKLPNPKSLNEAENVPCTICEDSSGYLIKCDYGDCQEQFHVRCAIIKDYIRPRLQMNDQYSKVMFGMAYIFQLRVQRVLKVSPKFKEKEALQQKEYTLNQFQDKIQPINKDGQKSQDKQQEETFEFQTDDIVTQKVLVQKEKVKLDLSTKSKEKSKNNESRSKKKQKCKEQLSPLQEKVQDKRTQNKRKTRSCVKLQAESSESELQQLPQDEASSEEEDFKKKKKLPQKNKRTKKEQQKAKSSKDSSKSTSKTSSASKLDKLISDKFQIDKKKQIKKAIKKSDERDKFLSKGYSPLKTLPKPQTSVSNLAKSALAINNTSTNYSSGSNLTPLKQPSPPKQISGIKMHLLVEQILQQQLLLKQQQELQQQQLRQEQIQTQQDIQNQSQLSMIPDLFNYQTQPYDMNLEIKKILNESTSKNKNDLLINEEDITSQSQPSNNAPSLNQTPKQSQFPQQLSNYNKNTPQRHYQADRIKLVQVNSDLAKMLKLPKVIVKVEDLIVSFKEYILQKGILRIQSFQDGENEESQESDEENQMPKNQQKFFIDLTHDDEMRNLIGREIIKGVIEDDGDLEVHIWKNLEKLVNILKIGL